MVRLRCCRARAVFLPVVPTAARRGKEVDARRLAAHVRRSLEQVFDGAGGQALDEGSLVELCGDDALGYLTMREHTVTELVGRLVDVVVGNGSRLSFIDPTIASLAYASGSLTGAPKIAAWQFGIDLIAVREAGADVEVTGYLRSPLELEQVLSPYRRPQSAKLSLRRPRCGPSSRPAGLQQRRRAAFEVGRCG